MKILYLRRLESSAAAFEASIARQANFQERSLQMLHQGRLLDAASYRKLGAQNRTQAIACAQALCLL